MSETPTIARVRRALEEGKATLTFPDSGEKLRIETVPDSACRVACPAGVNVKAYVGLIGAGEFERALRVVQETNALPGICGRVCTHPCEAECRRRDIDAPVAIRQLKRFIADYAMKHECTTRFDTAPPRNQSVAVVGSGPAGITAANDLVRLGYRVTVFEALPKPGGMLRVGIPRFRLPHEIIDHEIESVAGVGVRIETGSRIDDPTRLLGRDHAAVFYAVGAHDPIGLGLELENELAGVVDCTDFLREANLGLAGRIDGTVLVIGGGNSAVDSARVARRLGARDVRIHYRRTRAEMPAYDEEVEDALAEDIAIEFLVQPVALLHEAGRVTGLRCLRTRLGAPDASGRRRPEPVPGSEFDTACDLVVKAIGQRPGTASLADTRVGRQRWGGVIVDERTCSTTVPGLFAGGDAVTGPATVIDAIAAGHRAARGIDAFLTGRPLEERGPYAGVSEPELVVPVVTAVAGERAEPGKLPGRRVRTFDEVEGPLTRDQAISEARRCLRCGPCAECVRCHNICPRRQVLLRLPGSDEELLVRTPTVERLFPDPARPRTVELTRPNARPVRMEIAPVIAWVDEQLCRGCGRCADECIHDAIELVDWHQDLKVARVDPVRCRGCGNCLTVCPSGAMHDRPAPGNGDEDA